MSLVGSLEDLGLGDILQIVSLSRKSGLLLLRSEVGDGRIIFRDGLVRAAYVKGKPEDLRSLLVPGGFAEPEQVEEAIEVSRESGVSLDQAISERCGIAAERLDSLRREHVERAVIRMFSWNSGEFSFEVRDEIEERDAELALPVGINAQYLSMEAARLGDESGDEGGDAAMEPTFSGEDAPMMFSGEEAAPDEPMFSGEETASPEPVFSGEDDDAPETSVVDAAAVAVEEPAPVDDEDTGEYATPSPFDGVDMAEESGATDDPRDALALATAARADRDPVEPVDVAAFDEEVTVVPAEDSLASAEALSVPDDSSATREMPAFEVEESADDASTPEPSTDVHMFDDPEPAPEAEDSAPEPMEAVEFVTEPPTQAEPAAAETAAPTGRLIMLDPDLRALEWMKGTLAGIFERIHIFQSADAALGRIRQYLARGIVPVTLISSEVEPDRLNGTGDLAELLRRLRTQAPRMPLLVVHEGAGDPPPGADAADAVLRRPPRVALGDRRKEPEVAASVERLRSELGSWARADGQPVSPPAASGSKSSETPPTRRELQRLKAFSRRLRDPANRGDVLNVVLDFASETFSRVAMFMVRDELAIGIAQRGLPDAGGPDDEAFHEVQTPVEDPAWFRTVFETGDAHCAAPDGEGDRRLIDLLGGQTPAVAYVAPIESGGRLAALLYADNLPTNAPVGDVTGLDIVIHEAGLALDRALLERALAKGVGAPDTSA